MEHWITSEEAKRLLKIAAEIELRKAIELPEDKREPLFIQGNNLDSGQAGVYYSSHLDNFRLNFYPLLPSEKN